MDVAQLAVNLPLPWHNWNFTNSLFVDIQTNFSFVALPGHIDSTRDIASTNNVVKYFEIKAQYYKWDNVTLDKVVAKETSGCYKVFLLALIGNYMLLLAYFSRLISGISHQARNGSRLVSSSNLLLGEILITTNFIFLKIKGTQPKNELQKTHANTTTYLDAYLICRRFGKSCEEMEQMYRITIK